MYLDEMGFSSDTSTKTMYHTDRTQRQMWECVHLLLNQTWVIWRKCERMYFPHYFFLEKLFLIRTMNCSYVTSLLFFNKCFINVSVFILNTIYVGRCYQYTQKLWGWGSSILRSTQRSWDQETENRCPGRKPVSLVTACHAVLTQISYLSFTEHLSPTVLILTATL